MPDWVDKMAALGSYARQAANEDLEKLAYKIHARAIRRCGELMLEIEKAQGGDRKSTGVEYPLINTRTQAAKDAGMSDHQRKQALRIASIDEPVFLQLFDCAQLHSQ